MSDFIIGLLIAVAMILLLSVMQSRDEAADQRHTAQVKREAVSNELNSPLKWGCFMTSFEMIK